MLLGVYVFVCGEFKVQGKIVLLFDVLMGLDFDVIGFENIYLCGIFDGLKLEWICGKIDEIVDFSEFGDYLNLFVCMYLSGMMLCFVFVILMSIEVDILIMDEWLSVGDVEFSWKVVQWFESFVGQVLIFVLVLYDLEFVVCVCICKILMEYGQMVVDELVICFELIGDMVFEGLFVVDLVLDDCLKYVL